MAACGVHHHYTTAPPPTRTAHRTKNALQASNFWANLSTECTLLYPPVSWYDVARNIGKFWQLFTLIEHRDLVCNATNSPESKNKFWKSLNPKLEAITHQKMEYLFSFACWDVSMCWCVDVLPCWCVDVLMGWCVDVLMCWCFNKKKQ